MATPRSFYSTLKPLSNLEREIFPPIFSPYVVVYSHPPRHFPSVSEMLARCCGKYFDNPYLTYSEYKSFHIFWPNILYISYILKRKCDYMF